MSNREAMLMTVLTRNASAHLVYLTHEVDGPTLHVHTQHAISATSLIIPLGLEHCRQVMHVTEQPSILRCRPNHFAVQNAHQQCQNEPIQLGTQIQPQGKDWVGTAGAPVHWLDGSQHDQYGVLSNWHVMADGSNGIGHTQHQPYDNHPAMAKLTNWSEVKCCATMYVDAAIADAKIDGYHTMARSILEIGQLNPTPLDASAGLLVMKSGRTTALTYGQVSATGAAVKVSYGDFTATFADQIVIDGGAEEFSAGGDSGSLVVGRDSKSPVGLLFAGGGGTTIANPIKRIMDMWGMDFAV